MSLVALGLVACGGARPASPAPVASEATSAPVATSPTALRFEPPAGISYTFERTEETVTRRETRQHVARGTWTPTSATESALHVDSTGDEWSHPADTTLHFDARGLVTDDAEGFSNLPNLDGMGLVVAPIGAPGVALPLRAIGDGYGSVVSLAPLVPAGFPAEVPVACTLADENGHATLHCTGAFDSPSAERHPGWLTSLSYRVEITATLDAHGVALRTVQHVVSDIRQEQLAHVEHEGGESTVTTVLQPAS